MEKVQSGRGSAGVGEGGRSFKSAVREGLTEKVALEHRLTQGSGKRSPCRQLGMELRRPEACVPQD